MNDDLDAQFAAAYDRANNLPKKPSQPDLLRLYAHYKQATAGDASGKRPGLTQLTARLKFDAWANLKGTDGDTAKQQYIAVVDGLEKKLG